MEPPHPPPTQQHISPGLASGSCLFCGRVWNEHESQPFIMEDRKRKLESLSKDDSFSSTMFRYILGNQPGSSYSSGYKEIFDRFTRVRSQNQSTGQNQLPLCHTCLGLIYELRELHVTLERIQNLIIDKVKEIQEKVHMGQARGGESEEQSPHEAGDNWETTLDNHHAYLFPFPNAGESGGGVSPSFALQNLIMRGEGMGRHGVGDFDVVRNLKMDSELTQVELVEDGRGEINIPSSSQSDCGSSIADGSIDGPNFDGTRRGRRRKPVQLVDNAKKSRQELIAHMKGVNKDLYICDIDGCYAFFNTVQGLSQHKRQHFRDSWPVCGLCSYSTPWPSAMNRHFSTQHPNVDKNIKRPNRRNPSCAFTIKAFIQQNENPESPPSTSLGGGGKHNRNSRASTSHHQNQHHCQSSSSTSSTNQPSVSSSTSMDTHNNNSHSSIQQPHTNPLVMTPSSSLLQWKHSLQNHAQATGSASSNSHRRFCPSTSLNFNGVR